MTRPSLASSVSTAYRRPARRRRAAPPPPRRQVRLLRRIVCWLLSCQVPHGGAL